jgi:hypothetical protein
MTDDFNATLYLSTDQISTNRNQLNIANEVGGWSDGRRSTYFNVNMRTLLGELYDKYDYFLLNITSFFTQNSGSVAATNFYMEMGGLQWVKSNYDQATQANSYWAFLPTIAAGSGTLGVVLQIYDNKSVSYLFRKSGSGESVITFRYRNNRTGLIPTSAEIPILPVFKILFKIQPVPKLHRDE